MAYLSLTNPEPGSCRPQGRPYPPLSPAVCTAHSWAQDPGTGVVYENRTCSKQASEHLLYLQPQDARGRSQEVAFCHLLTDTEIHAVLRSTGIKGTACHRREAAPPSEPLLLLSQSHSGCPEGASSSPSLCPTQSCH